MKKFKPTQLSFMSGSSKIQAIKVLLKQLLLHFFNNYNIKKKQNLNSHNFIFEIQIHKK